MQTSTDRKIQWIVRKDDKAQYVRLSGTLSMQNSQDVFNNLKNLARDPQEIVYLSLRDLMRSDSSGLGTLVGLNSTLRSARKQLVLLEPNPFLTNLIKLSKLDLFMKIEAGPQADPIIQRMNAAEAAGDPNNETVDRTGQSSDVSRTVSS